MVCTLAKFTTEELKAEVRRRDREDFTRRAIADVTRNIPNITCVDITTGSHYEGKTITFDINGGA